MVFRETLDKDRSIFIYRVIRLPIELKPFIPILGTGLRLLLGSWEFSPVASRPRKNARVPLTAEDVAHLEFLMQRAKKSAAAVIAAALQHARHSHVRPAIPRPAPVPEQLID